LRRGCLLLAALLAGGCEQPPPTREIDAAQAQVEAARKEGAEQHAPDRWREAQDALKTARDRVAAKDYRAALSSSNLAAERARAAVQAVRSARALARGRTEITQAEVRALLEQIDAIRAEATVAKVPEEAFAELAPRMQEVQDGLQRVDGTLAGGDVLQAQRQAAELKAQADDLPTAFRQAVAKWQAEHPKGRRRRR
jgi:hypothetical protein